MADQAQRLRELAKQRREKNKQTFSGDPEVKVRYSGNLIVEERDAVRTTNRFSPPEQNTGRTIAITSGKGGVGKTNLVCNLAITLASTGKRVMLFDADLSLANIDVLLGLSPRFNLSHVLAGKRSMAEIIVQGPSGILIVPASNGVQELADLNHEQLTTLTNQFSYLATDIDFLLIDTAAGISDNVLSFVLAADEVLVVSTPEPTAYTDAYAVIKTIHNRDMDIDMSIIMNMVQNTREADEALRRMLMITRQFLNTSINNLGYIMRDPDVINAVRRQEAFVYYSPNCSAARCIRNLAATLLQNEPVRAGKTDLRHFFIRLAEYFRS